MCESFVLLRRLSSDNHNKEAKTWTLHTNRDVSRWLLGPLRARVEVDDRLGERLRNHGSQVGPSHGLVALIAGLEDRAIRGLELLAVLLVDDRLQRREGGRIDRVEDAFEIDQLRRLAPSASG